MRLEHTGMFCPHLVCALVLQQVKRIPSKYIPKRYTRDAKEDTPFDRHDRIFTGPDGDTKARRLLELLPDWCALQQSAVMSLEGVTKCKEILQEALDVIKDIPHDIGQMGHEAQPQIQAEDREISASAPSISNTKGTRKKDDQGDDDAPDPHLKRPQEIDHTRRCTTRNRTGHNSTTCGREKPPKRPRGRPVGSGTVNKEDKTTKRPRGRPAGTGTVNREDKTTKRPRGRPAGTGAGNKGNKLKRNQGPRQWKSMNPTTMILTTRTSPNMTTER